MSSCVFLLDVDNALLNNDELKQDLAREIEVTMGQESATTFWRIYEEVRSAEGYVDFPATLKRLQHDFPDRPHAALADLVTSIPFHIYIYPRALDAITYLQTIGRPVILSDGDPVFQRMKVERSGLEEAVDGRVILTTHKEEEMDRVFSAYPADWYVLIDDKTSILADVARRYPDRVSTVLVCQGKYARISAEPAPNLVLRHIGDIVGIPLDEFVPSREPNRTRSKAADSLSRSLSSLSHLLVDMDGVLFRGRTALPGASDFLPWLREKDIGFRLLTNNSTGTPQQNAAFLNTLGIMAQAEEIMTSAQATAMYLAHQVPKPDHAYVIGEAGLRQALVDVAIEITDQSDAKWVVAGLDRNLTYQSLSSACLAIEGGAAFIATNADTSLPIENGEAPGAGAIQAAITATTGVRPTVIGKPEGRMLLLAMEALAADLTNSAMLGDRLDTDIEAASRLGMPAILVLTGVSTESDLKNSDLRPDLVVQDLAALMNIWP